MSSVSESAVQRYVENVMLLDGRKFDLRTCVLVAALDPNIALSRDGYARVSLGENAPGNYSDMPKHLTNLAQRKTSQGTSYEALKDSGQVSFETLDRALRGARPDVDDPLRVVRCSVGQAVVTVVLANTHIWAKHHNQELLERL